MEKKSCKRNHVSDGTSRGAKMTVLIKTQNLGYYDKKHIAAIQNEPEHKKEARDIQRDA